MSLDSLKDFSLEINWLQDAVDLKDSNMDEASSSHKETTQGIRRRRSPNELTRNHTCPFMGCVRVYNSKNALKLHVKRNHNIGEQLKDKDLKSTDCIPRISPFKRGVNLKTVFKDRDVKKIECRAEFTQDTRNSENNLIDRKISKFFPPGNYEGQAITIFEDCDTNLLNSKDFTFEVKECQEIKKSIHEDSTIYSTGYSSYDESAKNFQKRFGVANEDKNLTDKINMVQQSKIGFSEENEIDEETSWEFDINEYVGHRNLFEKQYSTGENCKEEDYDLISTNGWNVSENEILGDIIMYHDHEHENFFALNESCENICEIPDFIEKNSLLSEMEIGTKKHISNEKKVKNLSKLYGEIRCPQYDNIDYLGSILG